MQPETPSGKPDENQPTDRPVITFDSGYIQIIEDHDTRGDPRYPPVKMPRNVPKDIRPRRPYEDG